MAIKERLLKQLNIVRDGLNAMPPFHSRDLNAMRNALVQARDLCFQGLPEKSFAAYKDTYDGLLLAIDQLAANAPDKEEIVSLCSELLQYTITQTQKEATFKKEIFFLPYKASMWDSLESVWRAADEDKEHCIAYVMPIPYADLTPEHTVAEWHCEKDLFPKDVPTVNWEDFDLQEVHPDVIFIHNPYDEYNRVTSVESRYYSSVLKTQTDKLVYIPYFVLAEPEIEGKSENEIRKIEEGIEGFVLTPAVLNAHQVIVQSEAMRQVYINVLLRGTDQKNRAYWEKRILGLGSPKIDKVLTSKKEDFELPEAWAKSIKGKKVILYNTSLSAMLQNSDKVCDKLRYVFDVFRNRDDVALWWRPHPLMKATLHSMRPELEREYCEIEDEYIKEAWGVYDNTNDLHRAIAWSDAYYGDASSVAEMYRKTKKTVLIQKFGSAENYKDRSNIVYSEAFCVVGDNIWYSAMEHNGLYCYDITTDENKLMALFPDEDPFQKRIHCRAVGKGGLIYFFPDNGSHVHILDTVKRGLEDISFDTKMQKVRFLEVIEYEDDFFLISDTPKLAIYKYISKNKTMELLSINFGNYKGDLGSYVVQIESKVYIVSLEYPVVFEFDCHFQTITAIKLDIDGGGFGSITYDGVFFWLSNREYILQWDRKSNVINKKYYIPQSIGMIYRDEYWNIQRADYYLDGLAHSEHPFKCSLCLGGKIYYFAQRVDSSIFVDTKTGTISILELDDEDEDKCTLTRDRVTHCHYFGKIFDNRILVISSCSGKLYIIRNGIIEEHHLLVSDDDKYILFNRIAPKNAICRENNLLNLFDFLQFVEMKDVKIVNSTEKYGESIYNELRA